MRVDEILIFVIWGTFFCLLLQSLESVSQFQYIFISNISVVKKGPVIVFGGRCSCDVFS